MQSLLSLVGINILEYGYQIELNWLGKFAQAIIEGVGILGWGIVVFTLVLKAITLPFDIYQRVKMRKQNLIMREMQPELEKLQKQYANDKNMYNQKMMELYKKNGYSMLGACLPMILSLVILIVAFEGFRAYSQYANLAMYEKMATAYSEEVLKFAPETKDFGGGRNYLVLAGEGEAENLAEGKIIWSDDGRTIDGAAVGTPNVTYKLLPRATTDANRYVEVSSSEADKFIVVTYSVGGTSMETGYSADTDKFFAYLEAHGAEPFYKDRTEGENPTKKEVYDSIHKTAEEELANKPDSTTTPDNLSVRRYMRKIGATAAADWYHGGGDAGFLWVKNVWYPDVVYEHPIQSHEKLKGQLNKDITLRNGVEKKFADVLNPDDYNDLTAELVEEKDADNGYFILIILSIGLMVLSQFISMRSSKESNKYQTVDGQGARTQKWMLIIMPIIYGIFAFMYSAAFSIYMTMSSVISLVTTLLSNLVIGRIFKKKEEAQAKERVTRKYAWQLTEKEKKEKEKREQKEKKMQERANRFNRKN